MGKNDKDKDKDKDKGAGGQGDEDDKKKNGKGKRGAKNSDNTLINLDLLEHPITGAFTHEMLEEVELKEGLANAPKFPTNITLDAPEFNKVSELAFLPTFRENTIRDLRVKKTEITHLNGINRQGKMQLLVIMQSPMEYFFTSSNENLVLPKLTKLDLTGCKFKTLPSFSQCRKIKDLTIAKNNIGIDGEKNWKALKDLKELATLDVSFNNLDWDSGDVGESFFIHEGIKEVLAGMKQLREVDFRGNPVVESCYRFREQLIYHGPELIKIDGKEVDIDESYALEDNPPAAYEEKDDKDLMVRQDEDDKAKTELDANMLKKKKSKVKRPDYPCPTFMSMRRKLVMVLDNPSDSHLGNTSKDAAKRAASNVSVLLADIEKAATYPVQYRDRMFGDLADDDIEALIEEFLQTALMMMQRFPSVARITIQGLAKLITIQEHGLGNRCLDTLLELREAGSQYYEIVVSEVSNHVAPILQSKELNPELRDYILGHFVKLSDENDDFRESLMPLAGSIAVWYGNSDKRIGPVDPAPSINVLRLVAEITAEAKMATELCNVSRSFRGRALDLLKKTPPEQRKDEPFRLTLQILKNTLAHNDKIVESCIKDGFYMELMQELSQGMKNTDTWSRQDKLWAAEIVAFEGMLLAKSQVVLQRLKEAKFEERMMQLLWKKALVPDLYTAILRLMLELVTKDNDVRPRVTNGLVGVGVMSAQYVGSIMMELADWAKQQVATDYLTRYELCMEAEGFINSQGKPLALNELRSTTHRAIIDMIIAGINITTFYAEQEERGDALASDTCKKLDAAGREDYLFSVLRVEDDDAKIAVVRCLSHVNVNQFQATEVNQIVQMVSECENITQGRNEEVLAEVLAVLEKIARDQGEVGSAMRRNHADLSQLVLRVLERNVSRDTKGMRKETEEKNKLSKACLNFLMTVSKWDEAHQIMWTRQSMKLMRSVLKYDQLYGTHDFPVTVEETDIGSNVQALLHSLVELRLDGSQAFRVLKRMADVVEGNLDHPPQENEDDQTAFLWTPTPINEKWVDRKERLAQHDLFVAADGCTTLLGYILNVGHVAFSEYQPRHLLTDAFAIAKAAHEEIEEKQLSTDIEVKKDLVEEEENSSQHQDHRSKMVIGNDSEVRTKGVPIPPTRITTLLHDSMLPFYGLYREAPSIQSALRVLVSILWYGESSVRSSVVKTLRDLNTVRALVNLASEPRYWYPYNIGARLLIIFEEVLRMPYQSLTEPTSSILLYDFVSQMLQKMIETINGRLDMGKTLSSRGELLILHICSVWVLIVRNTQYIEISDIREVHELCMEYLINKLLPVSCVQYLVRILFHDKLMMNLALQQGAANSPITKQRDAARQKIVNVIAEFLQVVTSQRYAVLEFLNRMEVVEKMILTIPFVQEILSRVTSFKYHHALEYYLWKNVLNGRERVLELAWSYIFEGQKKPKRRLLVVTNKSYNIMKQNSLFGCSACSSDAFCPSGPKLVVSRNYTGINYLTRAYGGQRFRIHYKEQTFLKAVQDRKVDLTVAVVSRELCDNFLAALERQVTSDHRPIIESDADTEQYVHDHIIKGQESIILYTAALERTHMEGTLSVVLILTDQSFYVVQENPSWWLIDNSEYLKPRAVYPVKDLDKIEMHPGAGRGVGLWYSPEEDDVQTPHLTIRFRDKRHTFVFWTDEQRQSWRRNLLIDIGGWEREDLSTKKK